MDPGGNAMVEIIAGEKGKGKTKYLLEKANHAVEHSNGNIVYLDKNTKHMYELKNQIRLINVKDYSIENCDEFIGFIGGIISQDHDLEELYLDSFLTIANIKENQLIHTIDRLQYISERYHVNMVLSISMNKEDLPENTKSKVVISL